ncbi:MAG: threonine/serine exporter family protein [Nakamurella sp.]
MRRPPPEVLRERIIAGALTLGAIVLGIAVLLGLGLPAAASGSAPVAAPTGSVSAAPVTGSSESGQQSSAGSPVTSPPTSSQPSSSFSLSSSGTSAAPTSQLTTTSASVGPSSTVVGSSVETTTVNSVLTLPAETVQTVVPATPPAAVQSGIGRGTVLIALVVLLIALVVVLLVGSSTRRGRRLAEPSGTGESAGRRRSTVSVGSAADGETGWSSPIDGSSLDDLMTFMVALGDTMVDSGDPVTNVSECLERVARVNGVQGAEIIVLPTALIITLPGLDEARTEVAATGTSRLRLDQVEGVFRVADAAERGDIGPVAALADLELARVLAPSYPPVVIITGHAVIAMGLAIILSGGWVDVGIAAVLGAGVGAVKQLAARRPLAIQVFLPVLCAFLVAAAVALLGRTQLNPDLLPPIIGALVTFIPGGLLTTAVIELATGQMISGASRFVYGTLQLVLLSLGIVAGLQLFGIPAVTVGETESTLVGAIAPWIGVLIFGFGVLLSYSGRPGSLGWMLLVLYVAYAGQVVGGLLFGNSLSAFAGAVVMTPVAVFVATQRTGPPTLVTFLPAFWLLVPGVIALVGVTQVMGEARVDGASSILNAGVTIVSIALGVVLGLSIGDWIKRIVRPPAER